MLLEGLSLAERRLIVGGVILGVMLTMVLFKRATITEVVRDNEGRIVQIVTMNQPMPLIGNWLYNVSTPRTTEKRKMVEGIIP